MVSQLFAVSNCSGRTDEVKTKDGRLYYYFPLELRAIIKQSSQFARLQKDVMFSLKQ